jgi:hypothetical protein
VRRVSDKTLNVRMKDSCVSGGLWVAPMADYGLERCRRPRWAPLQVNSPSAHRSGSGSMSGRLGFLRPLVQQGKANTEQHGTKEDSEYSEGQHTAKHAEDG